MALASERHTFSIHLFCCYLYLSGGHVHSLQIQICFHEANLIEEFTLSIFMWWLAFEMLINYNLGFMWNWMCSPRPLPVLIKFEFVAVCWCVPPVPSIIEIHLMSETIPLTWYGIPIGLRSFMHFVLLYYYLYIFFICIVFILYSVSFIACVVLCAVFCLSVVLFCVMYVICVLYHIVVSLPPIKNPFAV
jgi:hypothetical protein